MTRGPAGPVRVLHVITRLDRGGSAENTLLTAAGVDPARFVCAVATGPTREGGTPAEARAHRAGVRFLAVPHLVRPIRPAADLRACWELWRLMRRGGYGIVHTHTSKAGLLGRLAARWARVPAVVHTPHGHVFYGYYGPAKTRLFLGLERAATHLADRIVTLTEREVAEYQKLGVARPHQCAVIHSGVDFAALDGGTADREAVRRELGFPPDALVVGTVGRYTRVKAQGDLLAAAGILRERVAKLRLLLVGEGEDRPRLEAQARQLGLAGQAVLTGWRAQVGPLLRAMDVFALPSRNEGMGKALVEAMHCGLAVVATAVGGVPEVVEAERSGLLVPAGSPAELAGAVLRLALDPELRRTLGEAARQRAAAYGVEPMVEQIERLYTEVLEEKGYAAGVAQGRR
ncbi:MAG: glycosyltransferase family 4 protein [Candidatus Latescibacterota bacterium]